MYSLHPACVVSTLLSSINPDKKSGSKKKMPGTYPTYTRSVFPSIKVFYKYFSAGLSSSADVNSGVITVNPLIGCPISMPLCAHLFPIVYNFFQFLFLKSFYLTLYFQVQSFFLGNIWVNIHANGGSHLNILNFCMMYVI